MNKESNDLVYSRSLIYGLAKSIESLNKPLYNTAMIESLNKLNLSISNNISQITKLSIEINKILTNGYKFLNSTSNYINTIVDASNKFTIDFNKNMINCFNNLSNFAKFNNAIPEQLYNLSKFANIGSIELNNLLEILSEFITKIDIDPDIFISSINSIVISGLEYQVSNQGTVSLNNEYMNGTKELEIANEILNDETLNIEQKLYSIIEQFRDKHPIIVMFLVIFIFSSIQSYIDDIGKGIIKSSIIAVQANESNIKINKEIKDNVVKNIDKEAKNNKEYILNIYRFVNTNSLSVRVRNNTKSNKIYELKYGDVVKILKKNKNWSFIEYEEDEAQIRGWVFTRYISRFGK
ncbi:SH3 domain-containing protein [Clostridium baratii]|uniref:SH3 domain-containing protein n=1 Tax=Clostridium baratii TaxID=1561 RepID=UPI001CAD44BC|nr:SH3 domain-containing protein [Clostridium baratii]STB71355.1 Bacterial SH3 domain [Clostridium baratii]